jgi:hypothetical protein
MPSQLRLQKFYPLMPYDASFEEVLGFVEILGETGFTIPRSKNFSRNPSGFHSLATASRMVGLVTISGSRVFLTDLGLGFLKAEFQIKLAILRSRLRKTEPLASTIELLSKKSKGANSKDVSEELTRRYGIGEFDPGRTRHVLIEWGVSTGLIEYDGRDDKFYLV